MRRFAAVILMMALMVSGCAKAETADSVKKNDAESIDVVKKSDDEIVEIQEKFFITQCNEIYLNLDEYIGKTLKLEGFCDIYSDPETGKDKHFVVRKGPGCCGNDGIAGFEFIFDGELPAKNQWLEVVGKLGTVKENGIENIVIKAEHVTVKKTRGAEFVAN
jgi:uncharacterized membrane protein YcgQ (UPF0703/DUF1980 family)